MCDYSLHGMPNRLAMNGERLVVHRFSSGTLGLAPAAKPVEGPPLRITTARFWKELFRFLFAGTPECAVCVPPGAELRLSRIPAALRQRLRVESEEAVTFTQLTAYENTHRDAVRFRSGAVILLQELIPGQPVQVLNLGEHEMDGAPPTEEGAALSFAGAPAMISRPR
ncbi:MAG: hypothetical protein KIT09_29080 [Bryobacteraceae bacterium]|nr:hypothetical protein [Bryobacteraceae bacterium]